MKLRLHAATLLFFWVGLSPVVAKAGQWQHLASRSVSVRLENDTVHVKRRTGAVKRLKLTAPKNATHVASVVVHYANGDIQTIPINKKLQRSMSITFDVNGGHRLVDKVVLRYQRARPALGSAKVEVWALR